MSKVDGVIYVGQEEPLLEGRTEEKAAERRMEPPLLLEHKRQKSGCLAYAFSEISGSIERRHQLQCKRPAVIADGISPGRNFRIADGELVTSNARRMGSRPFTCSPASTQMALKTGGSLEKLHQSFRPGQSGNAKLSVGWLLAIATKERRGGGLARRPGIPGASSARTSVSTVISDWFPRKQAAPSPVTRNIHDG